MYGVPGSVAEQELRYALQFEPVREENQASIKKSAKGRKTKERTVKLQVNVFH